MAKFHNLPFNLSKSQATNAFELIHIDTWGPYKIPTQGNHKFFLTIVDDYTRHTWISLLIHKSDAFSVIKTFHNYAQNQFGKSIQKIRSDNAMEFADSQFIQFFHDHGILHHTSCSHKPQQNGRVERKHKHIMEVARALRLQAHLPVHLWGDCVQAAVHIINRLPSSVLNNTTPYYLLYKEEPDYSYLKVIGCLAFAHNPSFSADKLDPRGVPSLFLRYPPNNKGYKRLNLLTNKPFVSRDVKFYETVFPYHPTPYLNKCSPYLSHHQLYTLQPYLMTYAFHHLNLT